MKKIIRICIVILFLLVTCSCGNKYKFHSNYSENEIYDLVESYIYEETYQRGVYDYKIIKKEPLVICESVLIEQCGNHETIKGAYEYIVELTNKTTGRRVAHVSVKDKYYWNSEVITPNVISRNLRSNQDYYYRYDKLIGILKDYNSIKYYLIDDELKIDDLKGIQYGYIYSNNIDDLEVFLKRISKNQYEFKWDFIVTNNLNKYNELINSQNSFDEIINQYEKTNTKLEVDLSSFKNNPNAMIENTSRGSNHCRNEELIKK